MVDQLPDPPDLGPEQLSTAGLSRSKRGYDQVEVTTLLGRAADALRAWQERDRRLWERVTALSADLDDALEVDEDRITAALGEETARIISVARSAAGSIRDEATQEAAQVLQEAEVAAAEAQRAATEELESSRLEAERIRTEATLAAADLRREAEEFAEVTRSAAESRRAELVGEAERVLGERTAEAEAAASAIRETAAVEREAAVAEAERIRTDAREAAAAETERAVEECRAMVAEAQEYREQVLRSLAARHQEAHRRIDAVRAERDRIVSAIREVGSTLDLTVDDLSGGEDVFDPEPQVSVDEFVTRASAELRPVPTIGSGRTSSTLPTPITIPGDPSTADTAATDDEPAGDAPEASVQGGSDGDASSDGSDDGPLPARDDVTREEAVLDRRILGQTDDIDDIDEVDDIDEFDDVAEVVTLPTADDAVVDGDGATVHDLFERVRAATGDDPVDDGPVDVADDVADGVVLTALDDDDSGEPADPLADGGGAESSGALDRRDVLLEPVGEALARSLKRAVSDEQNEVLDQLRRARRAAPSLDTLLGEVDDVSRYLEHVVGDLRSAARAGAMFWMAESGQDSHGDAAEAVDREAAAGGRLHVLVGEVLGHRRAHLARVLDEAEAEGLDLNGVQGRVRGAYREWRSAQCDGAAGDLAAAGFAVGVQAAAHPGARWCWLVDNGGLPCSDAEDNALAGPVTVGEEFPTGDTLPPAHSGCRCTLVPAPR